MDLAALRREYGATGLTEGEPDPFALFHSWLADAVAAPVPEPNAMVLATSGLSARTVLLKGLDEGFVFYTNYDSRKAAELAADPRCALVFPWHAIGRQVRVEGTAARVSREESAAYFASRPRGSQLGAWASPQSAPVSGREELEQRYAEVEERYPDEVPLPPNWGGYRITPSLIEFWQGRSGRLHDRLCYRRTHDGWTVERLGP